MSLLLKIENAERKASKNALPDYKLVFVHVPKNFGTTTANFLFRVAACEGCQFGSTTHMTANQINSLPKYRDYKTFCFVRHPYDRYLSVFRWRLRKDNTLFATPSWPLSAEETKDRLAMALEHIAMGKVQRPLDYDFEETDMKLDRMFLPQTTWHNQHTSLYQCENYYEELNRLMEDHHMRPSPKLSRVKNFLDENGKCNPKAMSHLNNSAEAKRVCALSNTAEWKELFFGALKDNPALHKEFIRYYRKDFMLFDYSTEIPA